MRGIIDGEYQDGEIRGLIFLCGMRGMGKTTEMDRLLSQCTGGVVFFDTLSKHSEVLHGYVVLNSPGKLSAYLRMNRGRRFHILYQPRSGDLGEHFAAVCTIVRAFGWMVFGVDELDKLCGPEWGAKRMPPEFYHLVNYGRHERVSMIATARCPTAVPRGYTAESEMRIFRTEEKSYREYFSERLGKEASERLASLPRFSYMRKCGDEPPEICGGARSL